ncbi:alginate lyase family protein [Mucilaginibacter sp. cycad4]|uniref:alginate lyase family protein n=1 Tax=Mucilaginibacter sp. cycad4 TaxID=3342096 RepID=UPI002AAC43FE|nr:alginate lyase family protein [Mucilaginibacter gossypii]WPU99650.1 alginate lyase family protein [Mucilaginibacter gossypii]
MNSKPKTTFATLLGLALFVALFFSYCTKKQVSPAAASNDAASPALKTQATGFIHPGILNTQQTLDYVGQQANSNDANRLAAYQFVLNYCNNHSPSGAYKATVQVAGGVTTPDEIAFKGDALLSYALALRWAKTGTASYATTVKQILDGWASHFQNFSVTGSQPNQASLEASWAAPTFAAAAEIIKYYIPASGVGGGWTTAENTQFVNFLNNMKDNYINNVPNFNNNWNVSAGYAKMAIGVFEDSQTVYQNGITAVKTVLPNVIASDGSMNGEICGSHNDYVHYQYSLTGLSYAANIAGIQGDLSIYSASSSRLLTGFNYQYKLMHGTVSPPCSPNGNVNNPIWPGIEVANRHYGTTETSYIASNYVCDSNGLPNGDIGFLCWTNYTHNNVPTTF